MVCRSTACSSDGACEPLGGCDVDADCTGGNWCMESTHTCTAELPNGVAIPNDPPHTSPTLNAVCTAGAGLLVCISGVCDTNDNDCGYANGDGPCTPGPTGNGAAVCRSGQCSVNLTCEPAGGCNVDADCSGGKWCDESVHTCMPQLPNGTPVPTDGPHTNPTLNGVCTAGAGALVCISGVCDTNDNDCGYANGDGPCTAGNASTVCRSGACSTVGTCEPNGGCNVDADCTAGNWCNETTHACTPQLRQRHRGTERSVAHEPDAGRHVHGSRAAPSSARAASATPRTTSAATRPATVRAPRPRRQAPATAASCAAPAYAA